MTACLHCDLPLPSSRAGQFCCFGCRLAHSITRPVDDGSAPAAVSMHLVRLILGVFLAINLMALNVSFYAVDFFGSAAAPTASWGSISELFGYLALLLTTMVVVLLGLPLAADAIGSARERGPGAQLLIVIGVFAAYALSVWNTVRGTGPTYYDTASMVLVIVTLGNYVEARAKRRAAGKTASALEGLPRAVRVRRDGRTVEIDAGLLRPGDEVQVRPGQALVVDGTVVRGRSLIDSSRLTGESLAPSVAPGSPVLAGSIAIDGELWVRARRVGERRVLAGVERLFLHASRTSWPGGRLADTLARALGPATWVLALAVLGLLSLSGEPEEGLLRALSVLLIACPCALAFGPSITVVSAMRRAVGRGVVFTSAAALERAARLRRLFFDKTGTLTEAASRVEEIETAPGHSRDSVLKLLASIEAASLHPFARGVVDYAARHGIEPHEVESFRVLPGLGVEARLDGRRLRLGGSSLLEHDGVALPAGIDEGSVFLIEDTAVLARLSIVERPRDDAGRVLESLRAMGVEVGCLSGDRHDRVRRLAERFELPFSAGLLPEDKMRRVEEAGRALGGGGTVGMIGDGLNDAPVLARADVGFAVATATDLARQAGDVVLLRERLSSVVDAVAIARHARRRLALILGWALAYNGIGMTLALLGLLRPTFAATAMIVSSLLVVGLSRGAGARPDEEAGAPVDTGESAPDYRLADGVPS